MGVEEILARVDDLLEQKKRDEAEALLLKTARECEEAEDREGLLKIYNELMGYYREVGKTDESYDVAERAIELCREMNLADTVSYATTLLNVATVYRAGGRLQESLKFFMRVGEVYSKCLKPDDILVASMDNNLALLYQEMGEYESAKKCLMKALSIVEHKAEPYELAITYANLSSTCQRLGDVNSAYAYGMMSCELFEQMEIYDSHYAAAQAALAACEFSKGHFKEAETIFAGAMEIIEKYYGQTPVYKRLEENRLLCREKIAQSADIEEENANILDIVSGRSKLLNNNADDKTLSAHMTGLEICRAYYEEFGRSLIEEKFPEYAGKIAVGLSGKGSDCFGFDDALSRDHDWGPSFCMWVSDETYRQIGERLKAEYAALPREYMGYRRTQTAHGEGRRGVIKLSSYLKDALGTENYDEIDWRNVSDTALAELVNGEIFKDEEGTLTAIRNKLKRGYPEEIRLLKVAECGAKFSQSGQYNLKRVFARKDQLTAGIMLADACRYAMKLLYYAENKYPPHDKWLYTGINKLPGTEEVLTILNQIMTNSVLTEEGTKNLCDCMDKLGGVLATKLYEKNLISDVDEYLDMHTEELLEKSVLSKLKNEELIEKIVRLEFEAFDRVTNQGGRAECQDDWETFKIMRMSQYMLWDRLMLTQYYYDFNRSYRAGHNLIEEKYGRMEEFTDPDEYASIKMHFAPISAEKKAVIDSLVTVCVEWMEEFADKYPKLAKGARSIHADTDTRYNTSYETYLRGEISTYSDKMLQLFGNFIVGLSNSGRNLAFETMGNSVKMYGYRSLDEAEAAR